MMKKLLVLMLVLAIVLQPVNAFAASNVDLSRVKFSTGSEPLVFTFGKLNMDGVVEQVYPFTEKEIDQLVKETLKSMNLTELDIKEANQMVQKAKRASEFTKEDMDRVRDNMLTTLKAVPAAGNVATVLEAVKDYMGSSSWDDIGTASVDILERSMTDWVKDTAGGFIDEAGELGKNVNKINAVTGQLLAIEQFCEMMMDEHARTKEKWKAIADGANAKRMLNKFYDALQRKIDNYKYKSDQKGWQINFNHAAAGRNFTFFGVDSNYQTWFLDMNLEQKATNEYGSVAGIYEGNFTMSAEHEMSSFETRAHEAIVNMGEVGAAIKKIQATPGYKVELRTVSPGDAYISRTISGTCEAEINVNGEITIKLNEENDETMVVISGMEVEMDYSVAGAKIIKGGGLIKFQISADKEEIVIGGVTAEILVKSPDVNFSKKINGSGTMNAGWDNDIWKHWDGAEKTLKHAGR